MGRFQRFRHILAGHRAEELAALADFDRDRDFRFRELGGEELCLVGLLRFPVGGRARLLLGEVYVLRGGGQSQLLRKEEVAPVTLRDLDDLAFFSDALDVLLQYDFHDIISPCLSVS